MEGRAQGRDVGQGVNPPLTPHVITPGSSLTKMLSVVGIKSSGPIWRMGHSLSSSRNSSMRVLLVAIALGLLAMSQAASTKEKTKAVEQVPSASTSKVYTAEEMDALGKTAREKDEARQRAWDQKTKNITRGICSGC
jgi:hypothetical protein